MSQINPLTGSILQATQAQREMSTDKAHQMRHSQKLQKNAAARDEDEEQEQVDNCQEAISAANGDQEHDRGQRRRLSQKQQDLQNEQDQPSRLDLTA